MKAKRTGKTRRTRRGEPLLKVLHPNGWSPVAGWAYLLPTHGKPGAWMPKLGHLAMCYTGYHLTTPSGLGRHAYHGSDVYLAEARGSQTCHQHQWWDGERCHLGAMERGSWCLDKSGKLVLDKSAHGQVRLLRRLPMTYRNAFHHAACLAAGSAMDDDMPWTLPRARRLAYSRCMMGLLEGRLVLDPITGRAVRAPKVASRG